MKCIVERQSVCERRGGTIALFAFKGSKGPEIAGGQTIKGLSEAVRRAAGLERFVGKEKSLLVFYPEKPGRIERVIVAGLGERSKYEADKLRMACGAVVGRARKLCCKEIHLLCPDTGRRPGDQADAEEAVAEGCILGQYRFTKYQAGNDDDGVVEKVSVVVAENRATPAAASLERGRAYAEGAMLARDLVNEPAMAMTPVRMAQVARDVARKNRLALKIFDERKIEAMGMGALRGVSVGSAQPPRFVHLFHRSPGAKKTVAIIGKGITFDSGGLCIKPADGMLTMKDDMAGAAAVLGIFSVIRRLNPKVNVHGIFAATENMPGGRAYKTGDVLRAMNGKTIEIINTDAEGRLILADSLSYASRLEPDEMIDMATLTGACVVALGNEIAGLFCNDEGMAGRLVGSAKAAGEKLWSMPLEESYREMIRSEIADIKNSGGRWGGAITAALFLREFVGKNISWAHVDIAGPCMASKQSGYLSVGGTGVMVRTMLRYLLAQ